MGLLNIIRRIALLEKLSIREISRLSQTKRLLSRHWHQRLRQDLYGSRFAERVLRYARSQLRSACSEFDQAQTERYAACDDAIALLHEITDLERDNDGDVILGADANGHNDLMSPIAAFLATKDH